MLYVPPGADSETRIQVRKVDLEGEGNTGRGVGEVDRGMAANGGMLLRPVTPVKLKSMGKLPDMVQNTHFRTKR